MQQMNVGIVGCGTISATYLNNREYCPILHLAAVADVVGELARERASSYGVEAVSVDEVFASPDLEAILVLTPPRTHFELCRRALEAGKHVYTEKPLGVNTGETSALLELSARTGRRIGCAPDTFLAGAHQQCRRLVDDGEIGRVFSGHALFTGPVYPGKQFFADPGAGPLFDQGVYLVTTLVNLLGPVRRVAAFSGKAVGSYTHPDTGVSVAVNVPTHFAGILEFDDGVSVTFQNAWGVKEPYGPHIDLFGTNGTLYVPDPNQFRPIESFHITRAKSPTSKPDEWLREEVAVTYPNAALNPRILGLADMAHAIRSSRPHRASGELGHHATEVMEKMTRSTATGRIESIESAPARPAPADPSLAQGLFE